MKKNERKLYELISFTTYNKIIRKIYLYHPLLYFFNSIKEKKNEYIFKYNKKEYKFSILNDNKDLQKTDIKKLNKFEKRNQISIIRTLKMMFDKNYKNPILKVCRSKIDDVVCLIENDNKIIDYSKNLIMDKDEYYNLFEIEELNSLTKYDAYLIYSIMTDLDDFTLLKKFLLCYKEMIKDISKNTINYTKNYNKEGINRKNYLFFGNNCDCAFYISDDFINWKYGKLRNYLADFTMNPTKKLHFIKKIDNDKYQFKFGDLKFEFLLLSDSIIGKDKEILLSPDRYGQCHENSYRIASNFKDKDVKNVYIVGGSQRVNDKDSCFHSWTEIELEKYTLVIDYNMNLIMKKEDYYKIFGSEVIERTKLEEYNEILNNLDDIGFDSIHTYFPNYIGKELNKDAKKVLKYFEEKRG